jgi:hypothetical protein
MKLVMIYNSSCATCLPYVQSVKDSAVSYDISYQSFDINEDIFSSIHHIVNCRICIDRNINEMPLLIIFKNDTPCEAIVGVHDAASIDDKLKGVFL